MSHLGLKLEVANMANSELETTRAPREEPHHSDVLPLLHQLDDLDVPNWIIVVLLAVLL